MRSEIVVDMYLEKWSSHGYALLLPLFGDVPTQD